MDIYWILFTLMWTIFYQKEITSAASFRIQSLDFPPEVIGASALQHGSNQPLEERNYYIKRNEKINHRARSPYDRRHRQIFTSKTYFGRSQLLDLPRKNWNSKKDGEIAPLRTKTPRYMHPVKQSRLFPHDYISSENHEHIPHFNREIPPISEYNARPDANIVHVLSDNYDPYQDASDRTQYGMTPERDINVRYEPSPEYNTHDGYGSNPQLNANYKLDQTPRYDANAGYVQFPEINVHPDSGYEQHAVQMQENDYPHYDANIARGNNYGYGSKAGVVQEPEGNQNFRRWQSVRPNTRTMNYVQNHEYDSNVENRQDYKYVHPGHGRNLGYVNHQHQLEHGNNAVRVDHYGRPTNVEKGRDSEQNFRRKEILQNTEEEKAAKINLESKEKQKYVTTDYTTIIKDYNQILGKKSHNQAGNSELTSTVSDFETISDETLAKEEIFRVLSDKNLFKQKIGGTQDILSEDLEGSGSVENSNEFLPTSDLESTKSARILKIFSRDNFTDECVTPKNESGHCRGLKECPLLETMENFSSFLQYMCLQKSRLVGICCPDNPVVEVSDSQENSTEKVRVDIQQPPDGCGISTRTRIVGGTMSVPHEFSWMVALLRRGRFYCGGVIINNWYILTAAHCVLGIKISDLKVRFGEFDFHQRTDHQMDIPVSEIKRHALFVTLTFQHDIALLKLKRKIEYTKFIGSICLPNKDEGNFTATNATVVGWGTVSFGGAASPVLRKVTVPVWDNKQCDETYVFEKINDAFMCAGSPESGEDACQGDSGGPLMSMNGDRRWSVIGIVSWGRRCGDPTYPGVYTRITSYLDWIAQNAQ